MNTPRIDPARIPGVEYQNMAITFMRAIKRFYEDPKNEAEFREWLKHRNETEKEKAC